MKKFGFKAAYAMAAIFTLMTAGLCAAEAATPSNPKSDLKIGVINFRKCVEESKKGKQETAALESMQSQMESALQDLQKQLTEVSAKLNDADYLDGVTPAVENELKHKYRTLGQEYQTMQQQFVQALQQANMKVVQGLAESVAKLAKTVAQSKQLSLVVNEEVAFYHSPTLDLTDEAIALWNKEYEQEEKVLLEQQKNATNNKNTPVAPIKK